MHKQLTQEQIKQLFIFCRENEIYEYDIQIEIVDHLASAIEDQWENNPEITFEHGLTNIYNKFGWKGFRKIESQIKKQLKQKLNRKLWNYFLGYFKLPKIIITAIFILSIFTILKMVQNNYWVVLFISLPVSLFSMYYHYYIFPKELAINVPNNKTFMLLDYLKNINSRIGIFIQFPFFILMFSDNLTLRYSNTFFEEISISILFSFLAVLFYGYFFILPKKIREYFMKNYFETAP